MQSSHAATTVDIAFDDPNLIAAAGLVPVLALAKQVGWGGAVMRDLHPTLSCAVRFEDVWSSATVELTIVGYQFPDHRPRGPGFDWDANWLRVRGSIRTPELSWAFTDPCLTADEAVALGRWLREVANGTVEPSDEVLGRRGAVYFTEPNVSVRLAARDGAVLALVWYFSQESSPPGASDKVRFGFGHPVEIAVSAADLTAAVADWTSELSQFPRRAAE